MTKVGSGSLWSGEESRWQMRTTRRSKGEGGKCSWGRDGSEVHGLGVRTWSAWGCLVVRKRLSWAAAAQVRAAEGVHIASRAAGI